MGVKARNMLGAYEWHVLGGSLISNELIDPFLVLRDTEQKRGSIID